MSEYISAAFSFHQPDDIRVKRVRGGQTADFARSAEAGSQIHLYAVWPHHVSQRCNLHKVLTGKHQGICIDVGDYSAVDADRGIGPCIIFVTGMNVIRQQVPVPDGASGIAAFNGSVKVVPVVEQPQLCCGLFSYRKVVKRRFRFNNPQQVKDAVQDSPLTVGGNHCDISSPLPDTPDYISLLSGCAGLNIGEQ